MHWPWAFIGLFTGLWKLIVVSAAVAIFVWKKGWWRHPLFRLLKPWASSRMRPPTRTRPVVPTPPPPRSKPRRWFWGRVFGDRWYFLLFLAVLFCLLAWLLLRLSIAEPFSTTP